MASIKKSRAAYIYPPAKSEISLFPENATISKQPGYAPLPAQTSERNVWIGTRGFVPPPYGGFTFFMCLLKNYSSMLSLFYFFVKCFF